MKIYDVIDTQTQTVVWKDLYAPEVAERLQVSATYARKCGITGHLAAGKYLISESGKAPAGIKEDSKILMGVLKDWDAVRAPFLKVEWVKRPGAGVLVLGKMESKRKRKK